jgi:mono/diheme cytochrome c family protein
MYSLKVPVWFPSFLVFVPGKGDGSQVFWDGYTRSPQKGAVVKRWIARGVGILVAVLLLIQLIPYGHSHTDPPVVAEPAWDSPQTRELAVRACFDCHSNETKTYWFSSIAPFSWLIQHDIDEGRRRLNFSDWTGNGREVGEAAETVREGSMPPIQYKLIHPESHLTDAERTALEQGLQATLQGG